MRVRTLVLVSCLAVTAGALNAAPGFAGRADDPVFAAPGGRGQACTQKNPCALTDAQTVARKRIARGMPVDLNVVLADGTYRLDAPLRFTAADSGRDGHRVIWQAARGATPVISGATRISGWSLADPARNIWKAAVPATLDTRQLYVDGRRAPIAGTTPAEQGLSGWGSFQAADGGFTVSGSWAGELERRAGTNLRDIEFVYSGGNGPWTQSRCRIDRVDGTTVVMQQPCWDNVTQRPYFRDASGGLPSMYAGRTPTRIENAYAFLHPGQWYLDRAADQLYYMPAGGESMAAVDVEAPRLETLVTVAGTLDEPVRNLTFRGLTFSHATWVDPSSPAGFADVQDNLRLTSGDKATPQGTCTFGVPPGTCPFGALTREPGNVELRAADNVTFERNRFTGLGAAGLVIEYGSHGNTVIGNEFTDIAGNAIILGDTIDPHPSDVGADDREISTGNTISNNLVHKIGVDYASAAGITVFFTQRTRIVNNELYDLPYTGISQGVIQGHVNNADHPDNATNINSDNVIERNLIHDILQVLNDGGAIYVEGHQGQDHRNADGSLDSATGLARGLTARGNVGYDVGGCCAVWYNDAGAKWVNWTSNVQWHSGVDYGHGGCQPVGHIAYVGNWSAERIGGSYCGTDPVDVTLKDNVDLPDEPGADTLPLSVLGRAGLTGDYRSLATAHPPTISYVSPATGVTATPKQVLVAGTGFDRGTTVTFGGVRAASVQVLSAGFLVVTTQAGTDLSTLRVSTRAGVASSVGR